ncbi:GNAT family N-acetyltransferase [Lysinibacillus sp. 54212]|uniref:GNAT family N-acetyltransferase n=1 Tax=Lysinibacillus sp. 54212 TaxID=3119829 RepID=UPI002FC76180
MFPILETERLLLREITEHDTQVIFNLFSNDAITRFYGQDNLTLIEQAEQFVHFFAKSYKEKRGMRWGIELKGQKGIIGTIGYNHYSPKHKRAEIGYELHPDYWGYGYAKEAVLKAISYGFSELGLTRIGAIVFLENDSSNHLLKSIGFQQEGILKAYMYQNGQAYDTYIYSLLNEN